MRKCTRLIITPGSVADTHPPPPACAPRQQSPSTPPHSPRKRTPAPPPPAPPDCPRRRTGSDPPAPRTSLPETHSSDTDCARPHGRCRSQRYTWVSSCLFFVRALYACSLPMGISEFGVSCGTDFLSGDQGLKYQRAVGARPGVGLLM